MIKRGTVFLLIICLSISLFADHKKSKKDDTNSVKQHQAKYSKKDKKNHKKKLKKKKRLKNKLISKEKKKKIRQKRRKKASEENEKYKKRLKKLRKKYKKRKHRGKPIALIDEVNGEPLYQGLRNLESIRTISADIVTNNYGLTGSGITIGVWDGGKVLDTHQEFNDQTGSGISRISFSGSETGNDDYNDHATHVAGTITATGIDKNASGFSPAANIISYDFNNDSLEMYNASSDDNLRLSNHSYGLLAGWEDDCWYGDTSISQSENHYFGKYIYKSKNYDYIAYANPNYIMVLAAGNDRGDTNSNADGSHYHSTDNCEGTPHSDHHDADGGATGYDTITGDGGAKNVITVGAVDGITNGWEDGSVSMSSFSGWGPMDDGRIKPDIVAKGVSVYSPRYTDASLTNEYISKNGTSMATPAITGAVGLILEYQNSLSPGEELLSSTVKGLLIHTADEAGSHLGPDYQFGWGLANIHKSIELMKRNSEVTNNIIQEIDYTGTEQVIELRNVSNSMPLVVTIVWTDHSYDSYADFASVLDPTTKTLVNDIDITLNQDATVHYPWSLSAANPADPATTISRNDTDNIEQIYVENPSGDYSLKINHTGSIEDGNQFISLFIDYAEHPTITEPESLSSTSSTFPISGTAISNSTVQLHVNGAIQSTVESDTSGNWQGDIQFSDNGSYTIQAVVTENMNTRTSNEIQEITTTSNIITLEYAGIMIETPSTGSSLYSPSLTISGMTASLSTMNIIRSLNADLSASTKIDEVTSDENGNFSKLVNSDLDGTLYFGATANINDILVTSNIIELFVDIYKPQISSPTIGTTIEIPTFNISGTSEPNILVEIYEDGIFTASGNTDVNGDFNIEVRYNVETGTLNHNYTASASVTVGGSEIQKESDELQLSFNVPYSHPIISTPNTLTEITTETFTLSGTTMANTAISILENGVITANSVTDAEGNFSITIPAPIVSSETNFDYTVTANIYDLNRISEPITLIMDTYKPVIELPETNSVISVPTFNITGFTQPTKLVEIYNSDNLVASSNSDINGNFSMEIRYNFEDSPQQFTASSSVFIDNAEVIKISNASSYSFNVADVRPVITSPSTNISIITTKVFYLEGTTSENTTVNLSKNGTFVESTVSDSSGFFSFTIKSPNTLLTTEYTVSALIYGITETASRTFDFDFITDSPVITIPDNHSSIESQTFELSGTGIIDAIIFIYEDGRLISNTTANSDGYWTKTIITPNDSTEYYVITDVEDEVLTSNILTIDATSGANIPIISFPKNLSTISSAFFTISGTATPNSLINMTLTGSSSSTTNSTTTDSNGNWTLTRATPSPDHYSIQVTSNESGTLLESEETTIKSTYDIEAHELSINFPENESSFSTSTLTLLGKSPAGTLNILVDSVVTASIFVSGGSWSQEISFSENKDYEISVSIHHNGISKTTDSIVITKNNIPLITETSNKNITNKSFTISGTAKENTLLTITAYKPNYIPHSGQSTESVTDFESIIGTITSDSNGNWSLEIPIEYSGNYSFIVYEEYGANNQINSETYSYDLNLENIETKLMIAPSPYNPQNGTLKIQYQIPDNQDVGINIYTLSGYRIYESTFLAGSPGALKGQNTITWDGRYNGSYISPGLYIIILKTGSDTAPIIKSKRVGVKW